MNTEILETIIDRKKKETLILVEDMKLLTRASMLLDELGYDGGQIADIANNIKSDIEDGTKEIIRLKNSYDRLMNEEQNEAKCR